jgi:hypothetical protein
VIEKLKYVLLIPALLLAGCQTPTWRTQNVYVPPPGAHEASETAPPLLPITEYMTWCKPKKINSNEEAMANIKNLLNSLYFEDMNPTNIDVDKYGMRAKLQWTESKDETTTSTTFNNNYSYNLFWGIRNYFGTNTTYQTYKVNLEKTQTVIIPFNEVFYISLGATPDAVDSLNIYVFLKNGTRINVKASNEYDAKLFTDSLYTLSMASFGNRFDNKVGILEMADLTDDQKKQLEIKNGCYVSCIERNSPAWNAGITAPSILVKYNGNQITSAEQANDLILNTPKGPIKIEYIGYGNEKITVTTIKPEKR